VNERSTVYGDCFDNIEQNLTLPKPMISVRTQQSEQNMKYKRFHRRNYKKSNGGQCLTHQPRVKIAVP
jgi:hypothetical protein